MSARRRLVLASALLLGTTACADLFGPETWVVTMDVASQRVPCQGFIPQECLRVREHPDTSWTYFYDAIEGFVFEPGFDYTLRVRVRRIENPPQDASNRTYRLLAILNKTPA